MFLLKPKMILVLAVVSGLLAFYGFSRYMQQREEDLRKPIVVTRPVVVTTANRPLGTTLKEGHMEVREWPEDIVPSGSFRELEELIGRELEGLVGRVLKTDVIAGEPILASKLAPKGSSGGVSSLIPPGMRAMTVAVNVVSGVGGFILPKAKVDILATVLTSSKKEHTTTKMILQNVQVLAVDQTYRKNDDDPIAVQSVTLLITPAEAEKVALAGNEGKLQLTLRNSADAELHNTAGVRLSQLFGSPKVRPRRRVSRPPRPPKVETTPSRRVVEVIRANVRSEVVFEEEEGSNSEDKKSNSAASKQ